MLRNWMMPCFRMWSAYFLVSSQFRGDPCDSNPMAQTDSRPASCLLTANWTPNVSYLASWSNLRRSSMKSQSKQAVQSGSHGMKRVAHRKSLLMLVKRCACSVTLIRYPSTDRPPPCSSPANVWLARPSTVGSWGQTGPARRRHVTSVWLTATHWNRFS